MAPVTSVKSGGSWRTVSKVWVKVAGTWQPIQNIWVKAAGTWQKVYAAAGLSAGYGGAGYRLTVTPTNAASYVNFNTDGSITHTGTGSVQTDTITGDSWYTPTGGTPGNSYYVRFSTFSGSAANLFSTGVTLDTWHLLSQQRYVGMSQTTLGARTGVVKVDISADQSTVLLTGNFTLTAEEGS